MSRLQELLSTIGLPPGWQLADSFVEQELLGQQGVELVGLLAKRGSLMASGSAGALGESPVDRAFFELLERCSVMDAAEAGGRFALIDEGGRKRGEISQSELFPPPAEGCAYARSNGVAVGPSVAFARGGAYNELIERDILLRAWYGQLRFAESPIPPTPTTQCLAEHYELGCWTYRDAAGQVVAAAQGEAKDTARPVLVGFGVAASAERAVSKAFAEALQRIAFLWPEELPQEPPSELCSAGAHQDYYLVPRHAPRIAHWLRHGHLSQAVPVETAQMAPELRFADLTPAYLKGRLWVLRALGDSRLPLAFGVGYPGLNVPVGLKVHPIS